MYNPFLVDLDDSDDDLGLNEVPFGTFRGLIVGIRYYKGRVNNNEMVSLKREPHNPYDRNAIRVENVFGVQVGHIKREQASVLAKIMDRKRARLEGVVPYGMNNKFSMPCNITLWGNEDDKDNVVMEMRRGGLDLSSNKSRSYSSYEPGANNISSFGSRGPAVNAVKVSSQAMKRELDQLFEKMTETSASIPAAHDPAEAIKTNLFPHQKSALSWMMACENENSLPPFWEERGPKDFFNTVTNFSSTKRPDSVRGGILADDMGLGKTLEIISLIVTNFKNGKNLVTIDKSKEILLNADDGGIVPKKKPRKRTTAVEPKRESFKEIFEINDDEEDEKMEVNLPPLPSFTTKEDPDFIISEENVPPLETTTATRRPRRAAKRPVRYTYDEENNDSDCEMEEICEPRVSAKSRRANSRQHTKTNKKTKGKEEISFPDTVTEVIIDITDDEQDPPAAVMEVTVNASDNKDVPPPAVVEFTVDGNQSAEGPPPAVVEVTINTSEVALVPPPTFMDVAADPAEGIEISSAGTVKEVGRRQSRGKAMPKQEVWTPSYPGEPCKTYKSKKTKAGGSRATLIVCPLSVLSNWQDEISKHIWPGLIDVYTYYGSDRIRDSDVLSQKDIVLTTYQTLTVEASKEGSPLQKTKWLRVVLDEGHCIRNPNALQTKKILELQAERRWIVTGTPIQNSMKDLWSLICFLRLEPFTNRQWWTRVMERPIKNGESDALIRLQQLMKVIAMRRTKNQKTPDGKPIVDIPDKSIFINYIELSPEERDVYKAVAEHGKVTIGKYMKTGTLLKNYTEVLAILTRLRQLCCHPKLCTAALEAAAKEALENSTPDVLKKRLKAILALVISTGVDEECPICLDSLDFPVITHCAHIYCKKCIENVIKMTSPNCPMCRGAISSDQLVEAPCDQEEEDMPTTDWNSSAKVDALLNALETQRQADPTVKCLVVSQFSSYLRLLRQPLEGRGFQFVHFDGSLTQEKRAAAIREFSDASPGSPKICLLSLKAGGVGLNLTAASRVFLMDPAWNPAAEDQCFDRCHRLGQTKSVEIHKFIVKDSIEERMLDMQKEKRKLMSGAFAKQKAEEIRQQRIRDVTNLINII